MLELQVLGSKQVVEAAEAFSARVDEIIASANLAYEGMPRSLFVDSVCSLRAEVVEIGEEVRKASKLDVR